MSTPALKAPGQSPSPLQTAAHPNFYLKIKRGQNTGATFKLMAREITIGRSRSNDISLTGDSACSRQHARIRFFDGKFTIECLNEDNPLTVNGQSCLRAELINKTEIEIGSTLMQFIVEIPQPSVPSAIATPNSATPSAARKKRPRSQKKSSFKIYIYGGALLVVVLLLLEPPKKNEMVKLRTQEQIEAEMKDAQEREVAAKQERTLPQQSESARQAKANYIKGTRDYRKGVYNRAIEAFQACLSLEPNNQLCLRYLKLSERKQSELIQQHMILGRSYLEQNQFSACANAFSNVMIGVRDPTSTLYKEAKANYEACRAQLEGRY